MDLESLMGILSWIGAILAWVPIFLGISIASLTGAIIYMVAAALVFMNIGYGLGVKDD